MHAREAEDAGRVDEIHVSQEGVADRAIRASNFVLCAGAWSGKVAELAGIGRGRGSLRVPLPVEPRKRYVYCVHVPDGPGRTCPMTVDTSGVYFRPEGAGGHFLCGQSPVKDDEPSPEDFEVDHDFFHRAVWPRLADRVRAFNELKVTSSWAGFYDYNTWDQNAVIGWHPNLRNLVVAAGFSGHGLMHSPASGRAVAELILHNRFKTLDLSKMGFERLVNLTTFEEGCSI